MSGPNLVVGFKIGPNDRIGSTGKRGKGRLRRTLTRRSGMRCSFDGGCRRSQGRDSWTVTCNLRDRGEVCVVDGPTVP